MSNEEERKNLALVNAKSLVSELSDIINIQESRISKLKEEKTILLEKNETWNRITNTKQTKDMAEVAQTLYTDFGRNKIFKVLRELGVLKSNNTPYQQYVDSGYFKVIEMEISNSGFKGIGCKTQVTPRGIDYIRKKVDAYRGI